MHMFIHCKRLRGYWEEIFKRIFDRHIDIDIKSVLLSESSNCHLTLAKYAIFLSWTKYKDRPRVLEKHNVYQMFTALCDNSDTASVE